MAEELANYLRYDHLDNEEYILEIFMEDMPNTVVSFRRPNWKYELWAFWSEPTLSPCITDSVIGTPTTNQWFIAEKIKHALLHYHLFSNRDHILIQFWAPITTETGCFLVTTDQPFALSYLDEGLLKYRKHCLEYKFNVDDHHGEEGELQHLGIPGRVFCQKSPEGTTDVQYYSTKEYPQRNVALTCNIVASFALPVFQTSSQDCVGVLEFVTNGTCNGTFDIGRYLYLMPVFKDAGLKSSLYDCFSSWIANKGYHDVQSEIFKKFKAVCSAHKLPLAQMWVPCSHHGTVAYDGSKDNSYDTFDVNSMGQVLHFQSVAYYCQDSSNPLLELLASSTVVHGLQGWQGFVGRAYLSRKLCFCRDITQFSASEFPFLPDVRHFGLTSCFAICLQNTCTGQDDSIIEIFLHRENTYGEDPITFLCSILKTMKQHFKSFKLASGEELEKELSIEIIKPRMNQQATSFQCESPVVLHNGQRQMQPHSSNQPLIVEVDDINHGRIVINAEQNNIHVSCSDRACMNQETTSFQWQSTGSPPGPPGVLHNEPETMQPHSSNQQLIVEVDDINNNGRNVLNAEKNNILVSCSYGANSITFEELRQHFGKKLGDIAQNYNVSRSTFKRICRRNGIFRWPQGKRNKVNDVPLSRQDPQYTDLPGYKLVANVAHMPPLTATPPEIRTIIIKATYEDDMVKFQLPISSRMVELEEEVSKRFKLNVGTYKIKYTDDDGDLILIACDKDLHDCVRASNSLGMETIKMFIEPITKYHLQPCS